MLSEKDGVTALTRAFRDRGYDIENDVAFDEEGVVFDIDGWDAAARVGFEYRTSEADDKHDLTDDELGRLGARIERGELALLIIDDTRVPDAATMDDIARRFLDLIENEGHLPAAAAKKTKKKKQTAKTQKESR